MPPTNDSILVDGKSRRAALAYFNGGAPFRPTAPAAASSKMSTIWRSTSPARHDQCLRHRRSGGLFFLRRLRLEDRLQLQGCRFDDETRHLHRHLRAANDRFCAVFNTAPETAPRLLGERRLDQYPQARRRHLRRNRDYQFRHPTYDLNRAGDVAVSVNTGLRIPTSFLKTANGFSTVFVRRLSRSRTARTCKSIYSIDLRDDRRVSISLPWTIPAGWCFMKRLLGFSAAALLAPALAAQVGALPGQPVDRRAAELRGGRPQPAPERPRRQRPRGPAPRPQLRLAGQRSITRPD